METTQHNSLENLLPLMQLYVTEWPISKIRMRACLRACLRVCVRACVRTCVRACVNRSDAILFTNKITCPLPLLNLLASFSIV